VYETAVNKDTACGKNACIAIGFSVFLAHLVLLVCHSVVQCVAVCRSVLQCVAVCCSM